MGQVPDEGPSVVALHPLDRISTDPFLASALNPGDALSTVRAVPVLCSSIMDASSDWGRSGDS